MPDNTPTEEIMEFTQNEEALTGGEEQNRDISSDLIRGHINTIILRSLYDGDKYGYDIINEIEKKSGGLYTLKQPTLYSALKRLEALKYVESYYGDYSNGGRRKYFSLTNSGRAITERNLSEWEYSRTIIDSLISDGNAHYDFSFITDKQAELVELKRALAAREEALSEEKTALAALKNELQRERALLSTQSASILSQKSDVTQLKDKINAQTKELEEKETALQEKETEILAKEYELAQKSQEIEETKAELENLQAELLEKQNTINSLNETLVLLKTENEEKNTEFYNKNLEIRALQAQIEVQKEKLEVDQRALLEKEAALLEKENRLLQDAENEKSSNLALINEEKQALDKKEYELSQREFALEEKERTIQSLESKENDNLKEQFTALEEQRKELTLRQEAYNQQQLDFITRKNALSAQQFELADKLTDYNAQVKLFNENLEKLESEKQAFEERNRDFESKRSAFEEEKSAFARTKDEAERVLQETQQKASEDTLLLSRQARDLQERELNLIQRENALNATLRDMQSRHYNDYYQQSIYPPSSPYDNRGEMNFNDLHQRAQSEGIRLQTAGNISRTATPTYTAQPQAQTEKGTFNMGLTLFKTAFIVFCIMAFESLAIFFLKDYLGTTVLYPLTAFTVGFTQFAICAILYACGYRPRARKKKNAPYVLTAFVIFVICVILTTMIAVYFKAQASNPAELLAFVIIPVTLLLNILFFAGLFYLFSTKTNEK